MSQFYTGSGLGNPPAESGDLRGFVLRLTGLLNRVAADLVMARGLQNRYRDALTELIVQNRIDERAGQILQALDSPTDELTQSLRDHGLDLGSAELELKLAAFDAAFQRSRYRYVPAPASGTADYAAPLELRDIIVVPEKLPRSEAGLHKLLRGLASAFKVANSILKSLARAIPAAGAYGEIKDNIEAGVDTLANTAGLLRKIGNKIPRPRRRLIQQQTN